MLLEVTVAEKTGNLPTSVPPSVWWAFRILVIRNTNKRKMFDIENVPKLIIDAFSKKQITIDSSTNYTNLGLYTDDTIQDVRLLEVGGILSESQNLTKVEIFYKQKGIKNN